MPRSENMDSVALPWDFSLEAGIKNFRFQATGCSWKGWIAPLSYGTHTACLATGEPRGSRAASGWTLLLGVLSLDVGTDR